MKKKRGDLYMMPSIVIGLGNDYIEKEVNAKNSRHGFFNNLSEIVSFSIFKRKLKKLDYNNVIEKNKDVLEGCAVIKGTRIPPKAIYEYFFENCQKNDFNLNKFINIIKTEYPSLEKKDEKTLVKVLLYYIAHEPIKTFLNRR